MSLRLSETGLPLRRNYLIGPPPPTGPSAARVAGPFGSSKLLQTAPEKPQAVQARRPEKKNNTYKNIKSLSVKDPEDRTRGNGQSFRSDASLTRGATRACLVCEKNKVWL